jgi:hypothetical protein
MAKLPWYIKFVKGEMKDGEYVETFRVDKFILLCLKIKAYVKMFRSLNERESENGKRV